jgi:Lrp/AsnC family leucine-responsive transcriptional regulator
MPTIVRKNRRFSGLREYQLDDIDWKIVSELQRNGRLPFAELGRRVGLAKSALIERVRRIEDAGIITGYRASVHPAKVGRPVIAFLLVKVAGNFISRIMQISQVTAEILECHRITGDNDFIMKVAVPTVEGLQPLIDRMTPFVATTTCVVLSTVVVSRPIDPPPKPASERKRK